MLSICNIDYSNSYCNGSYKTACDNNNLILKIKPNATQLTNYKLEFTKSNGDIVTHNVSLDENDCDCITYDVPISYYSTKGTMKVRLLSDEANSNYTSFINNEDSLDNHDICINYNANSGYFEVQVCTMVSPTGLPIATKTSLGVVKVGNGLSITMDGLLSLTDQEVDIAQTILAHGGDLAEVGLWVDDNPNNEDRLYRFLTIAGSTGREIQIANSTSQIVGTSNLKSNVGFLGNYYKGNENDHTKVIVSIIGVVKVKSNDSSIQVNDRVVSDDNGYAVKSSNNCGYRVLEVNGNMLTIVISPNTDIIQKIKIDMTNVETSLGNIDRITNTELENMLV